MNRKTSLRAVLLTLVMLFSLCTVSALAAEPADSSVDIIYFADGSYLTTKLIVSDSAGTRSAGTISGKKTSTYTSSSGVNQWALTVTGTFTYTGTSATATAASYSHTIYSSAWSLKSADAYCSGNQAIAEGTFTSGLLSRSATVTLSCSAGGTLS